MNLATWLAADNGRKRFPDLGGAVANALAKTPSLATAADLRDALPPDLLEALAKAETVYGTSAMPRITEHPLPWRGTRRPY